MSVSDLFDYLITLERSGYTGAITLNYHRGNVSKDIGEEPIVSEDV